MRTDMQRAAFRAVVMWVMAAIYFFVVAQPAAAQSMFDVGAGYTYVHTNAPPGDCGCFSMNGGNGWLGFHLGHGIAVVGEIAVQHASNIANTGADLTLTSFLAGPRYTSHAFGRLQPFAQVLLGGAHASGGLSPGSSGFGSSNGFAAIAGGGLEFRLSERVVLRAIEADYYYTRFNNGTNDHQNNLRIGAGLLFDFGSR
jgi:outer membrane immunogenic protein